MPIFHNRTLRIVMTGGGTGGHAFPLVAVMRELKREAVMRNINLEITYIGPKDFTYDYIQQEGIVTKVVSVGKFRRSLSLSSILNNIVDFFHIIYGLIQAYFYLFFIMPDVVFSKGSYASLPVVFWSIIFFIPTFTHESDSIPGIFNQVLGKFCRQVFISFESSQKYFPKNKTLLVGNPIRQELIVSRNQITPEDKLQLKQALKLSTKPLLTVIGGSLGSQHINDIMLDILPMVIDKLEIIHQTGQENYTQVVNEADIVFRMIIKSDTYRAYYHPLPFINEKMEVGKISLKDVYALSDLVVARAGGGLIFELSACGVPAILIPLPWASRDHQRNNAYEYAKSGACIVIEEKNATPNLLASLILETITDSHKLAEMSYGALNFAKPQAATQIAQKLLSLT
ncbi:MAG: UDP-N-acetylglucosamine--N-acetylmuramyl-(pentapeptide) pyrophosphoryl-undecaprenol N-acetylglucosamine transferase [Candidatus Pacebacteria bacterium]|nr:UDP-N-acetylglucosamine--N-acetylmuramyl-(pentapeptide) pyrophosphoryl-undecaprenol N-acetylglucosamine transferase [Candidatus Paceibacterota bacterium]